MRETNQVRLRISYGGVEYECTPDMRALMMIEERVLMHKLASAIVRGPNEIPATHLIWVVYCLLYCAGCRCTADDVREASIEGTLSAETLVEVARWLIAEVYGPAPRKSEDDEEDEPGKT